MKNEPSDQEMSWIVDSRHRISELMLELFKIENSGKINDSLQESFGKLVGAAFSLWRAVPLAWGERDLPTELKDRRNLLVFLLRDNAVNYTQDKSSRHWVNSYYLHNAMLRLAPSESDVPPFERRDESGQETWDYVFSRLRDAIGNLRQEMDGEAGE